LKNTEGKAQLRYFLIDPECRGQGLGRQLLEKWMAAMQELGYKEAFLLTTDGLEASAHLYGGYGFVLAQSRTMEMGLTENRYEMKLNEYARNGE
ncbi:MAG TPA: GNAT family N-acetyltransferase, partial [Cytophagales bacterium]|nr:GNAT family N-acetyltransferase [Cytophagales bacterium]